ncbi:LysR family transcriptional regulator [Kribbella turkmenica]|uniref:LysR family transcriptional regulator n=1 Tax=Kribbella turkmenica TaxID=2530375 RepID=A0A4R4XBM1_9ACTN|nr:LysR family transcriptional regulator [Kribbella turkmenica]TDD28048.1 LysR family transcriptional regulator [Kribbella turkmenica]
MAEVDLRLLRYFVAVAEQASFTKAAEALHLSQPALSQAILRLEHELGTPLLDRGDRGSRRGVALTHAGTVFLPAAREALRATEHAVRVAREAVEPVRLRVGFGTSTPRRLTRVALTAAEEFDHLELMLEYVPWGGELTALKAGQVDLLFLQAASGFVEAGCAAFELEPLSRMAVFPIHHELASRDRVSILDLADEPIVDAATDRAYWIVDPRPDGSAPKTVGPPARSVGEMLAFVSAGLGMAITTSTVAASNHSDDVAFVPISDLDAASIYLVTRADDDRPLLTAVQDKIVAEVRRSEALPEAAH